MKQHETQPGYFGELAACSPHGRFYLVANQFLRYEPALCEAFGNVTTIAQDRKYKLLLAEGAGG